jgi:hypothetical protein
MIHRGVTPEEIRESPLASRAYDAGRRDGVRKLIEVDNSIAKQLERAIRRNSKLVEVLNEVSKFLAVGCPVERSLDLSREVDAAIKGSDE